MIFLCGGAGSSRRDHLASYIRKQRAEYLLFYADDIWPALANRPGENALAMESHLAKVSDIVIVVVESPGTFAELGAFALFPTLRRKLLPIIERQYKNAPSFINTGPVRWVDKDSSFSPTLFADFEVILSCAEELMDRLDRIPTPDKARVKNLLDSDKHLLFFLCDLVAIFGPCSLSQLGVYIAEIVDGSTTDNLSRLIELACTMELIKKAEINTETFYFRSMSSGGFPSYQEEHYLVLPGLRATMLGAMLRIDEAACALEIIGEAS